jgi:hypothetical protein
MDVEAHSKQYYILGFYFPYLSFLVQPVNILKYWPATLRKTNRENILVYCPGPINIMFSSEFCPNSFFVLDIQ